MSDIQSSDADWRCEGTTTEPRIARTIKHGDTVYELLVAECKSCAHPVRRLIRTCGASISVYDISPDQYEDLDQFVSALHESFAVDVKLKLVRLRDTIAEFNSKGFFEASEIDVFHVRLIDKARLILNRFSKNGFLQKLLDHPDDVEDTIVSAFLLGCLATENYWIETHSEAVFEGWAHINGRESGRPLARAARLRQGRRTRKAVIEAASQVYEQDPLLRSNDTKTACRIADMKLDALRKRDGTFLGHEAVVKHLRAARRHGQLLGKLQ
jgi:hypothetical protein